MIETSFPITRDWIARRLSSRPVDDHPPPEGIELYRHPDDFDPKAAAVLVPLVNRVQGVTILLTQRTAHLNAHAGQISFPGGRVDPGDRDRIDTALRETVEETGLPRERVETLGFLPEFDIATGFRVTPVVGWIEPPFPLQPDAFEVADIFEVPLGFILDPANHRRHHDVRDGRPRQYFSMPWQDRNIWGATAGMLHSLYRILRADD